MKSICGLVLLSACAGASVGGKDEWTGETGFTETGSGGGCDTPSTWYQDSDGDGFGDAVHAVSACEVPEGTVEDATDCDDTSAQTYPGAPEICNDGAPNDCNDTDGSAAEVACPSGGPFVVWGCDSVFTGEGADDLAGSAVLGVGDVNGDGRDDMIITSPGHSAGTAYLVLNPKAGRTSLSEADATIAFTDEDPSGWSVKVLPVAAVGDQDGDLLPDVLVGHPRDGGSDQGGALVFALNVVGPSNPADATASMYSATLDSEVGKSVAGAGDVDGDGWDDLLIGAQGLEVVGSESAAGACATDDDDLGAGSGDDAGGAYLFRGPATGTNDLADADALFVGEDTRDFAGATLAGGADLNGDGISDMLLGSFGNCTGGLESGAAYIVLGPVSGTRSLGDADGKLVGAGEFSQFGEVLSTAGDVSGDGLPDILVGAPDLDGPDTVLQGAAYLFQGPAVGIYDVGDAEARLIGESRGFSAGQALAAAGDLNADGFDDVMVGALLSATEDSYTGAAYVMMGPIHGAYNLGDEDIKFVGRSGDAAGWSVAGLGDTNLDGLPDLLIGSPLEDTAGTGAGAAALILGGGPAFTGTWGP